jgi:hypothetical protein
MSKGKGRAGKQVRSKGKGNLKESADKRQMYDTEIEVDEKQSESDNSEGGGESVGEETEKPEVCLFSLVTLRC